MPQPIDAGTAQSEQSRPGGFGGCMLDAAIVLTIVIGLGIYWLGVMESGIKKTANHSQCGRNQAQILGALVAYAVSEETSWPDPRGTDMAAWKLSAGPITSAVDGAKYTAGAFELLAASQSFANALFKCPSGSFGGPNKQVKASISETSVLWGWDPPAVAVSYAFDWASPADPSAERVILADREEKAHRDSVMVTFGDAHVKKVKLVEVERGTGALVTASAVNASRKTGTALQPAADIFSADGDGGDPLTPGKGDPLRAWVK